MVKLLMKRKVIVIVIIVIAVIVKTVSPVLSLSHPQAQSLQYGVSQQPAIADVLIGYEPVNLTCNPPPRTAEGGFISMLPSYFENFIPEYSESQHDLRHNNIRLPAIRCEYEKMNAKYQMHYRLREFANPSRPPLYLIVHIDGDTLSQSLTRFSKYLKSQFILSYSFHCNINDCYTCQYS